MEKQDLTGNPVENMRKFVQNQIMGAMEIENPKTPLKKEPSNENIPQIDRKELRNLLISCYGKMNKNNITWRRRCFFGRILLILNSTLLGYVKYLKDGIENYEKLENDKKVLFSKVIYGFDDLMDLIPKKKLEEILDLMTKWEFIDNCPIFAKISHNLMRTFVNLANRKGSKGETRTKLFQGDVKILNLIILEKNPEQRFIPIKFSPDFIKLLKVIASRNICILIYNKVNAIIKKEQTNPEITRQEIIKIIDSIINQRCYFESLPTRGETLYNDEILINEDMSDYSVNDASKLDLIFTLLHEMSHVKRINCSFDSDYFSNTPKEFITQFKEFNDMNEEEKQNFWEVPEIDFANWNYELFKGIEEEIKAGILEDPKLNVDILSHKREDEGILRCTTRLDYNSNEFYALLFDISKIN